MSQDITVADRATKPRLLDLFCGAGGAAMGYHRAGFEVVGVDIKPQPHYPFRFIQADVMDIMAWKPQLGFVPDAIHASPPCQHYSRMRHLPWLRLRETWDSVPPTRELLENAGLPWVLENVEGAPVPGIFLCGQMFELRHDDGTPVYRHRLFETSAGLMLMAPGHPKHWEKVTRPSKNEAGHVNSHLRERVHASAGIKVISRKGAPGKASKAVLAEFSNALGCDWMDGTEATQAIPPAYTEWIGRQLIANLA